MLRPTRYVPNHARRCLSATRRGMYSVQSPWGRHCTPHGHIAAHYPGKELLEEPLRSRREHRDRGEGAYVALGDHVSSCCLVLLETISGDVGSVRRRVVPRLKQQNVVRVVLRDRDILLSEARLLHRRSA